LARRRRKQEGIEKMRHQVKHRKLNRTGAHRMAMLANLSNSLIEFGRISTTLPKAKELRPFIEKIITLGRGVDHSNGRRLAMSILNNKNSVSKLFDIVVGRFAERNGGYTRILKQGFRLGDNAPMAIIEFVD
jgi:large subunit ribosomal protein L17